VNVKLEYVQDPVDRRSDLRFGRVGGRGRIYFNGRIVGEGRVAPFSAIINYGSLSIGRGYDSPVSEGYSGPFPFTGEIEKVVVDVPAADRPTAAAERASGK
jgi:hypothetical protein